MDQKNIGGFMSMLVSAGITQCMNFYSIKDDQSPSELGADKDFFVGPNVHITLTIPSGETIEVRDIVVLGKLTVKSSNLDHSSAKGILVAHDIFSAGHLQMNYVIVKSRNWCQLENIQQFRQELQDEIIECFKFQRESVEKIGLRSILI